jgi:hypothetical protein
MGGRVLRARRRGRREQRQVFAWPASRAGLLSAVLFFALLAAAVAAAPGRGDAGGRVGDHRRARLRGRHGAAMGGEPTSGYPRCGAGRATVLVGGWSVVLAVGLGVVGVAPRGLAERGAGAVRDGSRHTDGVVGDRPGDPAGRCAPAGAGPGGSQALPIAQPAAGGPPSETGGGAARWRRLGRAAVDAVERDPGRRVLLPRQPDLRADRHRDRRGRRTDHLRPAVGRTRLPGRLGHARSSRAARSSPPAPPWTSSRPTTDGGAGADPRLRGDCGQGTRPLGVPSWSSQNSSARVRSTVRCWWSRPRPAPATWSRTRWTPRVRPQRRHRGRRCAVLLPAELDLAAGGPGRGPETSRAVFAVVHAYWSTLPQDDRPRLYLYGLSLGSYGVESILTSINIVNEPIDGALMVGPPFVNELWNDLVAGRDPGAHRPHRSTKVAAPSGS